MQQKDANEWKHKEVDGKQLYWRTFQGMFIFVLFLTWLIRFMTQQTFMTQLILIWNMTHIQLTCCQSSSIPIYPIVHMMSHIILLFLKCSGTFFWVCNISFMAALHSHQCCVSSLLMLRFMTHIAHNNARMTSSLHHSLVIMRPPFCI